MQIALIPPASLLHYTIGRPYQMLIPEGLQNRMYRRYYQEFGHSALAYVIMDNGAWEDRTMTPRRLLQLGSDYRVDELIAPDILNDPDKTLVEIGYFFRTVEDWKSEGMWPAWWNPKFAAVAHGKTVERALTFARDIEADFPQVSVIMIGRAFSRFVDDPRSRLELAYNIRMHFGDRFEIHLLGHNDDWIEEAREANNYSVRSLDTGEPFNSAYENKLMTMGGVHRPAGYFSIPAADFDQELVKVNIQYLDGEASVAPQPE